MTPPCLLRRTRILTVRGEIPVEDLREGDLVVLHDGETRPVKWIGWRDVPARQLAEDPTNAPVRIVAGAFGPSRPSRDLWVSGDHAIAAHGALIPAWLLINDTTVIWDRAPRDVTYYHVELETHGLLVSEGLATESFLEWNGNRSTFANAPPPTDLRPDFATVERDGDYCRPRIYDGPVLEGVRQMLAARADEMARLQTAADAQSAA